jgi:hypothetical protein
MQDMEQRCDKVKVINIYIIILNSTLATDIDLFVLVVYRVILKVVQIF